VLPPHKDAHVQAGPTLAAVPHLVPRAHVERVRGPWVGGWAQPAVYVRKHVPTQVWRRVAGLCARRDRVTGAGRQVLVQTPSEEEWGSVQQPAWERPGLPFVS
jgi:hypothetical protein